MQKLAQIFIQAKELGKKKSQQKRRAVGQLMLVWLLFVTPFVIPAIINVNQKLKETSWQELKENEGKYSQLSVCTDPLKRIELAVTNDLVYSILKQGNTCLSSLSFVEKNNVAYLNLLEIEKAIIKKETNIGIKAEIKYNKLKLEGDLLWSTQSGFIFLVVARSLAFGLLFWLVLVSIYQNWRQCLG